MIVRVNRAHWCAPDALRLAAEFGFVESKRDKSHVWFEAKDPIERYADWFIEGLRQYNFKYEVETWEPLTDPNPKSEPFGIDGTLTSGLPLSPLQPTTC